jgi:hypothetical protein
MGYVQGSPSCLRPASTLNFEISRQKWSWRYADHIGNYFYLLGSFSFGQELIPEDPSPTGRSPFASRCHTRSIQAVWTTACGPWWGGILDAQVRNVIGNTPC